MILNLLIVDDHPLQIQGYKTVLDYHRFDFELHIQECYDLKSAFQFLTVPGRALDIIFIDLSLPVFPEQQLFSGKDLALWLQEKMPSCKIVLISTHFEAFVLYDVLKQVNPDGFLIKSDIGGEELLKALEVVLHGGHYYSKRIKEVIANINENIGLDKINRSIITLLSQGIQTKSLPKHLHLSQSAIDKRKAEIKDYFHIEKGNDEDILREAKRLGFI